MFDAVSLSVEESAAILAEPMPLVIAEAPVPEEELPVVDEGEWAPELPPANNPFALLIEPGPVLAAAERMGNLNLPCRVATLEGLTAKFRDAELARFDAEVESGFA